MLAGIGAGSLFGGFIDRRTGKPAQALMLVQALFVAAALAGLGSASFPSSAEGHAIGATLAAFTPFDRWTTELWYNVRPILLEAGWPRSHGISFPLANAMSNARNVRRPSRRRAVPGKHVGAVGGSMPRVTAAPVARDTGERDGPDDCRRAGDGAAVCRHGGNRRRSTSIQRDEAWHASQARPCGVALLISGRRSASGCCCRRSTCCARAMAPPKPANSC